MTTTTTNPVPLSHYLILQGQTQQEFAESIKLARPSLSNIAAGRSTPQRATRRKISKALGVTNDELAAMLDASAELAAAEPLERIFARLAGKLLRLARQLDRPTPAMASIRSRRSGQSLCHLRAIQRDGRRVRRQPEQPSLRGWPSARLPVCRVPSSSRQALPHSLRQTACPGASRPMNVSIATHERLKAMRQAEQRAAEMAQRVKDQAVQPRTHDEQVRDATANYIAELEAKSKSKMLLPAEREQVQRRLEILKQGHAQVDATIKEAKRVEKFPSDHAYKNAREHFEAFSKSPAAPVSADDIALCGAILNSTSWDDPRACAFAYWREVQRAEQAAYEQASRKSADSQHALLKAELDAANDAVAAKQREQALAQARTNREAADGA